MPDIGQYSAEIHDDEDRPLFDDAVKAAEAGALRGAYVMVWLSCAESIKRRFREAQKRDAAAGKIVGDLDQKEKDHKSVDKFVLDKAMEYGFLTDTSHAILLNIYEMRCIYGHPYEQAPLPEQVSHAAAMVVEHVLSHPVRLRHSFADSLLKSLLQDKNFLDDQGSVVATFAGEIVMKIDERIHAWFLDRYWKELEKIADDASQKLFFQRGIYFCRAMLARTGPLFTPDDWHSTAGKYPKTLIPVVFAKPLFASIGERAQDSLLGFALDLVSERPVILQCVERLVRERALSKRQKERFLKCLDEMEFGDLCSAGLSLCVFFKRLLAELKSHNWYKQQPAVDIIAGTGPEAISRLDIQDQIILGRNVLQVADGGERSAKRLLVVLGKSPKLWPVPFLQGIAIECFVNEADQVRLKCDHLKLVLKILDGVDDDARDAIVSMIATAISNGTPKDISLLNQEFDEICTLLDAHAWAGSVRRAIERRRNDLVTELVDENSAWD
jgi:hypothetical protein